MSTRGPFSLAAAARFQETFPAFEGGDDNARLDLVFTADGSFAPVGVRVFADLTGDIVANPSRVPADAVQAQVERILSLDVDGTGFAAVGERDPVIKQLQERFAGLRPVLFSTPYEAAAWALICHRIRMTQAATIKRRMSEELGDKVDLGDRVLFTFPPPERLIDLAPQPGLTIQKVENLRALGEAAAEGELDAELLRGMSPEEASAHLRKLRGVGPFSAELILIRGAGVVDAFPAETPRMRPAMAHAYELGPEPAPAAMRAISESWRPYRSWAAFLLRNLDV